MSGILKLGETRFSETQNRLFAHQLGDGFIIVSEFGDESLNTPVVVAIVLMRYVLAAGGACKSTISEGDFADVSSCYPQEVLDARDEAGRVRIGRGIMTTFPVMGTALINAIKLGKDAPSGSLLLIDSNMANRIPMNVNRDSLSELGLVSIDWIHSESHEITELATEASLSNESVDKYENMMIQYIQSNSVSQEWEENSLNYLHLPDTDI